MAIRVVRLGTPRIAGEGIRLGTVRRPPRGVPKRDFARRDFYDVWLPELAPSAPDGLVGARRAVDAGPVAAVRAHLSEGDGRARGPPPHRAARRAVEDDGLLRRLLLRGRQPLPPQPARPAARGGRARRWPREWETSDRRSSRSGRRRPARAHRVAVAQPACGASLFVAHPSKCRLADPPSASTPTRRRPPALPFATRAHCARRSARSRSRPPTPRAQKLQFRALTPDEGLSSSLVQSIVQDSRGFMWFGTTKGLNRYDGYGFAVYRHRAGDSTSLAGNDALTIYEDSQKTLWVGTPAGLSRYDRERDAFRNFIVIAGDTVQVSADPRGAGHALGRHRERPLQVRSRHGQGDAVQRSAPRPRDPGAVRGQRQASLDRHQGQRRLRARSAHRDGEGVVRRPRELGLADAVPGEGRAPIRRGRRGRHLHGAR